MKLFVGCNGVQRQAAPLLSCRLSGQKLVTGAHGGRPRRGDLEGLRRPLRLHQSARQGQGALREGLLRSGQNGKHDQGSQALHQIRPNILPPLGGQPVPPVPAHRRLLATAPTSPGRAPPLAVAQGDVRNHLPRPLKIAGRIEELKSRIRIALPPAYPYRPALLSMAGRIQAQGP